MWVLINYSDHVFKIGWILENGVQNVSSNLNNTHKYNSNMLTTNLRLTADWVQLSTEQKCNCNQAYISTFSLMWPWPLTPNSKSRLFHVLAPRTTWVCSFSKYRFHKFDNRWMSEEINRHVDNIMSLTASLASWRRRNDAQQEKDITVLMSCTAPSEVSDVAICEADFFWSTGWTSSSDWRQSIALWWLQLARSSQQSIHSNITRWCTTSPCLLHNNTFLYKKYDNEMQFNSVHLQCAHNADLSLLLRKYRCTIQFDTHGFSWTPKIRDGFFAIWFWCTL